jgi:hypothetical protein
LGLIPALIIKFSDYITPFILLIKFIIILVAVGHKTSDGFLKEKGYAGTVPDKLALASSPSLRRAILCHDL